MEANFRNSRAQAFYYSVTPTPLVFTFQTQPTFQFYFPWAQLMCWSGTTGLILKINKRTFIVFYHVIK